MHVEINNATVTVTLSRRNVLALLHKTEMPGSKRTLIKEVGNGLLLVVKVEDDGEAYRGRVPGRMHDETERFISLVASDGKVVA